MDYTASQTKGSDPFLDALLEPRGSANGRFYEIAVAKEHLLILGASTRAAAFSALRADLRPWCIDLFGDVDLQACCPTSTLARADFPAGFVRGIRQAPPGPWIYTGALENRPRLVRQLARLRPLWGNDGPVLAIARSPGMLAKVLDRAGLRSPAIVFPGTAPLPNVSWLIKPRHGAGGKGIHYWTGQPLPQRSKHRVYYQEYIEGEPCAAVYVGDTTVTRLLGVTRQLVGEDWLHAAAFQYCGSVGPLILNSSLRDTFERLGSAVARGCGLRGLFGIDCVLRDGVPWPVEVNPRYTASMEVLEYAAGFSAIGWQWSVFDRNAPEPKPPTGRFRSMIGKAILFAKAPLTFPVEGPWLETYRSPSSIHDPPAFADIPRPGQRIGTSRPILTLLALGESLEACLTNLRRTAADLDRLLFAG
jgi:predicted ATP-grasp superfamily ATP-dependent carboligase